MIALRHVLIVVWAVLRAGIADRNLTFVLVVLGGIVAFALAFTAQAAAPFVLYPFA